MTSEFPELPDDIWARILGIYSHCPRAVYMVSKIARVSKFFFEYARPLKTSTCPQLPARVWLHVLNMFNDSNGLYAPKELDKISRVSTLFSFANMRLKKGRVHAAREIYRRVADAEHNDDGTVPT